MTAPTRITPAPQSLKPDAPAPQAEPVSAPAATPAAPAPAATPAKPRRKGISPRASIEEGATVGEEKNVQTGEKGDFICQNRTNPTDVWVVKRKLFLNTYIIKS